MAYLVIAIIVLLLLSLIVAGMYNNLVASKLKVDNSLTVLNKSIEKILNIVSNILNTSKKYLKYEQDIITKISNTVKNYSSCDDLVKKSDAYALINNDLNSLFTLIEAYPELKEDKNFIKDKQYFTDLENECLKLTKIYNNDVQMYNNSVNSFPGNIVAKIFGFNKKDFFDIN